MPEPTKYEQSGQTKPNWVDISTLVVLTLTLGGVFWYAYEARTMNELTRRPYVGVELENTDRPPLQTGQAVRIPLHYLNFGKLPADARVMTAVVFSQSHLKSGPDFSESLEYHLLIWPPPILNPGDVFSARKVIEEHLMALDKGHEGGWVYLHVRILYGGHRTEVCLEWEYPTGKSISLRKVQYALCEDPATNYTD